MGSYVILSASFSDGTSAQYACDDLRDARAMVDRINAAGIVRVQSFRTIVVERYEDRG